MPISRERVRRLCTGEEFELYTASLRVSLAALAPEALRSCVLRTGNVLGAPHAPGRTSSKGVRLRKRDLLAGALSRFEGRLRALEPKGI